MPIRIFSDFWPASARRARYRRGTAVVANRLRFGQHISSQEAAPIKTCSSRSKWSAPAAGAARLAPPRPRTRRSSRASRWLTRSRSSARRHLVSSGWAPQAGTDCGRLRYRSSRRCQRPTKGSRRRSRGQAACWFSRSSPRASLVRCPGLPRPAALHTLLSSFALAATHATHHVLEGAPISIALLVTVYIESAVALFCLWGLMCGDPGVVQRTQESCFPLPEYVIHQYKKHRVEPGQPIGDGRNLQDDERGTYCVRCMVWRNPVAGKPDCCTRWLVEHGGCAPCCDFPPKKGHHCRTCQRCVLDFDHHCGVFGRCIAGRGFAGNMGYFKVIITTGTVK